MTVHLQSDKPTKPIEIEDQKPNPDKDTYTILLKDKLKKDQIYEVFIPFKKEKSTDLGDVGYIQYEYTRGSDKPKK